MLSLLCTGNTDPVAVVLIETSTGHVWLPKSKAFGPADGTELIPTAAVPGTSPNLAGVSLAVVPDFPDSRAPGQYAGTLHPAAGGPPLTQFGVAPSAPVVKVHVSVGP